MGRRFLSFHICVIGDCFDLVCDAASPSTYRCHLEGLNGPRLIKSLKLKAITSSETSRTAPRGALSYTRRPESLKPIVLYVKLWRPCIQHCTMALPRGVGTFSDGKLSNKLCVCMCVRVIVETEHSQDWVKTCLNILYCPVLPFWSLPEKFAFSRFVWNRYVYKEDSVFWKLKENVLFFLPVT